MRSDRKSNGTVRRGDLRPRPKPFLRRRNVDPSTTTMTHEMTCAFIKDKQRPRENWPANRKEIHDTSYAFMSLRLSRLFFWVSPSHCHISEKTWHLAVVAAFTGHVRRRLSVNIKYPVQPNSNNGCDSFPSGFVPVCLSRGIRLCFQVEVSRPSSHGSIPIAHRRRWA